MPAEPAANRMLQLRISDELLTRIDRWRLAQGLPVLSRAAAIRRLLELALEVDAAPPGGE